MKISVLLSALMHTVFVVALVVLPSRSRSLPRTRTVYEVELVSIPRTIEEPPAEVESRPPIRPPEPAPVAPVKPKEEAPKIAVKEEKAEAVETSSSDTTETTGGVGSSQVKVETEDFPYSYYLSLIRYRVQENWRPPYQTLDEGEIISAIVGFRVLRDGSVTDINLENSSNRFLFDQAGQRAIRAMGHLPPLPEEFSGDHLSVHIEFESIW